MEIRICKTCRKQFLSEKEYSSCRICYKRRREEQAKLQEEAENIKKEKQKKRDQESFEFEVQAYETVSMESIRPSADTLYIIGNGFDLMHRVPSSYYNFRDSLGKSNSLKSALETALTSEDIWADFESALGTLNLDLMGSRDIVDMWLDDFGFYKDEDGGAAEFYMAVETAAGPISDLVRLLQPAFRRWIERLEIGTDDLPLSDLIRPQGKILDFNYTEFVETLYNVNDVCYIHGCRKKREKLILGHRPEATGCFHEKRRKPQNYRQAVIDVAQDNVFDLIAQYDEDLTKNSQEIIKNHREFFDGLTHINQIIVIGHSISQVDWDYFAEVKKKVGNAYWYFGIHGSVDLRNMAELVKILDIKNYSTFRTDGICTEPKIVNTEAALSQKKLKPRAFQDCGVNVTIRQSYEMTIGDWYEVVLPIHPKKIIIFEDYIFVVLDGLSGNILFFRRHGEDWAFVTALESFQQQRLINRRLSQIYIDEDNITFVYNNRVRKYDLSTGKMIANRQVRDAKNRKYCGRPVMEKFVGK